jgi:hypothetical protein
MLHGATTQKTAIYGLRVLENRVLRKIFGSMGEDVIGG